MHINLPLSLHTAFDKTLVGIAITMVTDFSSIDSCRVQELISQLIRTETYKFVASYIYEILNLLHICRQKSNIHIAALYYSLLSKR